MGGHNQRFVQSIIVKYSERERQPECASRAVVPNPIRKR